MTSKIGRMDAALRMLREYVESRFDYGGRFGLLQFVHDICLVWASKVSRFQTVIYCRCGQLGNCPF